MTLNAFGDSLAFRVVYAGPDELIYKTYLEVQTTDASNPVLRIPVSKDYPRSLAVPIVCAGDTAYGKPLGGQAVDFRLKVANNSSAVLAPAVTGTIRSLDTAAVIVSGNPFVVGDIAPGGVRLSTKLRIAFSPWCTGDRDISV